MKLYKYITTEEAVVFLQLARVKVSMYETCGMVSFSRQSWKIHRGGDMQQIVFQFEITPQGKKIDWVSENTIRITKNECEFIDGNTWCKLGKGFMLKEVILYPSCQLTWDEIRKSLLPQHKEVIAIKKLSRSENGQLIVDEEYRFDEAKPCCYRFNANHPSWRNREVLNLSDEQN